MPRGEAARTQAKDIHNAAVGRQRCAAQRGLRRSVSAAPSCFDSQKLRVCALHTALRAHLRAPPYARARAARLRRRRTAQAQALGATQRALRRPRGACGAAQSAHGRQVTRRTSRGWRSAVRRAPPAAFPHAPPARVTMDHGGGGYRGRGGGRGGGGHHGGGGYNKRPREARRAALRCAHAKHGAHVRAFRLSPHRTRWSAARCCACASS